MSRLRPKLIDCIREGYGHRDILRDTLSGITVGVIALPLAMAFGIASIPESVSDELRAISPTLTAPALGIYTAIVAGFLISALGGTRVAIGGPTGAFIIIVYGIAAKHGYAGLTTATLMAGAILILMGLAGFGKLIKFIPYPVTTGFTSGIAVVIAATQIKDFAGLHPTDASGRPIAMPPEFIEKVEMAWASAPTFELSTLLVGAGSLAALILFRRFAPRLPGAIIVVALASLVVWHFSIQTDTIGTRFGSMPSAVPAPHLPAFHPALIKELIPEATTIALLCAVESLLCAVVSDGMIGRRHRSDTELVAQGVANLGAACFWGIPATGAIARTVANIRSGGKTPLSGIVHAITLLLFLLLAAPLAQAIPLATLAAVLFIVAWNMAEIDHFRWLLKSPKSDILVLLTTFLLTVLIDLTVAVGVGMVLASFLFMKRMSELSGVATLGEGHNGDERTPDTPDLPEGVEAYEVFGSLFFGSADLVRDTLNAIERPPKVFILRMRNVLSIDATGLHALDELQKKCARKGTTLVLSGVHTQPLMALTKSGILDSIGPANVTTHINLAVARARELVGGVEERR